MNVLWTVNTLNPEIGGQLGQKSKHSISWVDAMSKKLSDSGKVDLTIACPTDGDKFRKKDRKH